LKTALVHRYSFNGNGNTVTDSVGTAHGTVVNTALNNTGAVTLTGGSSDQYVDLPNGIISSLSDATFECWLTWSGSTAIWQRIFDFGTTGTEGSQGSGTQYLFLTPKDGLSTRTLRAVYTTAGNGAETVAASAAVLPSTASHVTVVVNDTSDLITVYVNGTSVASTAYTGHLSGISDVNNWLGRSQYSGDVELTGSITEFRIYKAALTAKQVTLTQSSGSDPAFLP
jgi:hypothetical protein